MPSLAVSLAAAVAVLRAGAGVRGVLPVLGAVRGF
jgi:hypothetical protein